MNLEDVDGDFQSVNRVRKIVSFIADCEST